MKENAFNKDDIPDGISDCTDEVVDPGDREDQPYANQVVADNEVEKESLKSLNPDAPPA